MAIFNFLKNGPFLPRFHPDSSSQNEEQRGSMQKTEKANYDRKIGILAKNGQNLELYNYTD